MNCPKCNKDISVHLWQDENSCFCSYCFHVWNASQQTEIEQLRKQIRELREGLQRLGKHGVNCLGGFRTKKCICGLEKLLEEK
jgi:hypothetical protein